MVRFFNRSIVFILLMFMSYVQAEMSSTIMVTDAWARVSAPGAPSAGFMTVMNHGEEDDVLMDVRGDFAKNLELHRTEKKDGVMKMIHQKEGIVIPAGGKVVFKPGDYHLMFMGLKKNFELGETYKVTLVFKNAGEITAVLPVKEAPTMQMGNHVHTH